MQNQRKTNEKKGSFSIIIALIIAVLIILFSLPNIYTGLMNVAIEKGDRERIEFLLQFPGDVNRESHPYNIFDSAERIGMSPVGEVCCYGDVELLELFVEHGAELFVWPDEKPFQYVLNSANPNKLELTKYFVEHGANVEQEEYGYSPLLEVFRGHGLSFDSDDLKAVQALHLLDYEVMLYLIDQGARLDISPTKEELLVCVSGTGNLLAVEYLLETEIIDVNSVSSSGNTSLILAAKCGYADVVMYLLDHGADTTLTNRQDGSTAAESADKNGHAEIAQMIRDYE
jgi:FOG: Ankyrin repeat